MADCEDDEVNALNSLVTITITMRFNAKVNPETKNATPLDIPTEYTVTHPADADELEFLLSDLTSAVGNCRVFGLMQELAAAATLAAGEWVGKSPEEQINDGEAPGLTAIKRG